MKNSNKFTAIDLLETVIEFTNMTPANDWSFEKQKDNMPRLIRLQQINSLLQAFLPKDSLKFDIGQRIDNLLKGEFIQSRQTKEYKQLFTNMKKKISESKLSISE